MALLTLLAVCVPSFVVGPVVVMLLAVKWSVFPAALWESPLRIYVLPTASLGVYFAGRWRRSCAGSAADPAVEFIETARAKGLSETAVLLRPCVAAGRGAGGLVFEPLLADLLTGSFVIENLFQIPGIGVFMVNSSLSRDYPMVVGLVLLYAILLLVLNVIVDVASHLLSIPASAMSEAHVQKPDRPGVATVQKQPRRLVQRLVPGRIRPPGRPLAGPCALSTGRDQRRPVPPAQPGALVRHGCPRTRPPHPRILRCADFPAGWGCGCRRQSSGHRRALGRRRRLRGRATRW